MTSGEGAVISIVGFCSKTPRSFRFKWCTGIGMNLLLGNAVCRTHHSRMLYKGAQSFGIWAAGCLVDRNQDHQSTDKR
jgi:hypothetical protein